MFDHVEVRQHTFDPGIGNVDAGIVVRSASPVNMIELTDQ